MAEDLADLGERAAGPEHLGGGGVPEPVSVDEPEASAKRSIGDDPAHPVRREGPVGALARMNTPRPMALAGRPGWRYATIASPTSAGSGSRSARSPLPVTMSSPARQSMASSVSPATLPARSPSRTKQGEDREVATPGRTAPIARGEEALDLGPGEPARQWGQTPGRDPGHARGERVRHDPFEVEEAEQGAQGRHGQLGRTAWLARAVGDHERGDIRDRQGFERKSIRRDPAGKERPDRGEVPRRRGRCQAPLDDEIPAVPREEPIDRRVRHGFGCDGNDAEPAQVFEQRPDRPYGGVPRATGSPAGDEKAVDLGR
jgi:hypothetical protein